MTPQPTPFELVVEALLDDGHELHFRKEDGTIGMKLNSEQFVAISGVTLEQIGQLAISSSLSIGFKRIDGAEKVCQHRWHHAKTKMIDGQTWQSCPDCREHWRGTNL